MSMFRNRSDFHNSCFATQICLFSFMRKAKGAQIDSRNQPLHVLCTLPVHHIRAVGLSFQICGLPY